MLFDGPTGMRHRPARPTFALLPSRFCCSLFCCGALLLSGAQAAFAQAPESPQAGPLQAARAALTAGRAQDAVKLADDVLGKEPGSRAATGVKVEALIALNDLPLALRAYDMYMKAAGRADLPMLDKLARAELWQTARADRASLRADALETLAAHGDTEARQALQKSTAAPEGDAVGSEALARLGDAAALQAVLKRSQEAQGSRRAEALRTLSTIPSAAASPAVATFLRDSLKQPDPFIQGAGADAAAALGLKALAPDLQQALKASDPRGSGTITLALARLGDTTMRTRTHEMLSSPAVSLRLRAAAVLRDLGDQSSWVDAVRSALTDDDKVNVINAAELLLPVDRTAAMAVLTPATVDPNPAVRTEVARVMSADPKRDRTYLRAFLNDSAPRVRLLAATGIVSSPAPAR
jgi:HEAT repeat protein